MIFYGDEDDWEEMTRCKDLRWWCDDCEQLVSPELMAVSYRFRLDLHHERNLRIMGYDICIHEREVGSCKDCWEKKEHKDRDSRKWSTLKEWDDENSPSDWLLAFFEAKQNEENHREAKQNEENPRYIKWSNGDG